MKRFTFSVKYESICVKFEQRISNEPVGKIYSGILTLSSSADHVAIQLVDYFCPVSVY